MSQTSEEECVFCFEELSKYDIAVLNCPHKYHLHCIQKWNKTSKDFIKETITKYVMEVQMMQKEMGEIEAGKYTKEVPITENARGAQVYRKPTLALVAEKPGTAEYIMSDRNLARLAETIATQRENQAMNTMIPIMMGQGGGGTSMPVINNSYSYQNTENTVREMPTTSSLNMMTALA